MRTVRHPHPTDIAGLIETVRHEGTVHYAKQSVPADFLQWRREVRTAARAQQLRVSITRTADFVIVENRDYEVSDDDRRASTDVIAATLAGQTLSFDDAVRARRRQRMHLITPPTPND